MANFFKNVNNTNKTTQSNNYNLIPKDQINKIIESENFSQFVILMFGFFLYYFKVLISSKLKDMKKTEKIIKEYFNIKGNDKSKNQQINDKLDDILHILKADRIFVAQFHNGEGNYFSGFTKIKYTITNQRVLHHDIPLIENISNVPLGYLSEEINSALEGQFRWIPKTKTIPLRKTDEVICYSARLITNASKNKNAALVPLRIGLIVIQYLDGSGCSHMQDACTNVLCRLPLEVKKSIEPIADEIINLLLPE